MDITPTKAEGLDRIFYGVVRKFEILRSLERSHSYAAKDPRIASRKTILLRRPTVTRVPVLFRSLFAIPEYDVHYEESQQSTVIIREGDGACKKG